MVPLHGLRDMQSGVTELQRGRTLGNIGWKDNTNYIFRITFTPTLVEVYINDVKELNITGDFSDGSYGFYNYSQGNVLYSAIKAEVNTNASPVANAGEDQNVSLGDEITLDGTKSSDDTGIAAYEWKEGSTILSYDALFVPDSLSTGEHRIILTVEDEEGVKDTDEVVVTVYDVP